MKLWFSVLASFVSVVVIATALIYKSNPVTTPPLVLGQIVTITPTPTKIPIPVKLNDSKPPNLTATAAVAYEIKNDFPLLEKNPLLRLYPASTTKLATALVATDYFPLDKILTINGIKIDGQKMKLIKGEQMTVSDLLRGLLMFSANDAAEALAANFPGGKANFVNAMNLKMEQLNLQDTKFENPTGLDDANQFTTAKDLAMLAKFALQRPFIADTVKTKKAVVKSIDGKVVHNLTNINELLGEIPGVLGVKTGWTENAKENLVTYIERGNAKVIIVVLGSDDRFGETKKLIDWIFGNYSFN